MTVCHVLIIEDDAMIALDLESLLEGQGATSFAFAASQDEAIAAAHARRPEVIVSDVTLVEGTGPMAVHEIRSVLGPIPVLYISGTPPAVHADDLLTRSLHKPVDRPAAVSAFHELRRVAA